MEVGGIPVEVRSCTVEFRCAPVNVRGCTVEFRCVTVACCPRGED